MIEGLQGGVSGTSVGASPVDLESKKEDILEVLVYLKQNSDTLDTQQLSSLSTKLSNQGIAMDHPNDAIIRLKELSQNELTYAYDILGKLLEMRMNLVEKRLV